MANAAQNVVVWPLRWHYHCAACGWTAPQSDFLTAPLRCPRCGALPDGSDPWPHGTCNAPKDGWTGSVSLAVPIPQRYDAACGHGAA